MRILLIEDESELAHWVSRGLARHADFVVEWANDGLVADRRLTLEEFDAVVLDLGLPGMDGHTLLQKMRARDDRTPVLVLTARDSLTERVGSLHQGADDFLPKPFNMEELEARLIALVRRSRGREHPRLTLGDLVLDTNAQRFSVAGQPLSLSRREYVVLRLLIQRSGEPVSKQQILDRIESPDDDITPESIEVLMHRLRKKLISTRVQIVTMRGMGYSLEAVIESPGPDSA